MWAWPTTTWLNKKDHIWERGLVVLSFLPKDLSRGVAVYLQMEEDKRHFYCHGDNRLSSSKWRTTVVAMSSPEPSSVTGTQVFISFFLLLASLPPAVYLRMPRLSRANIFVCKPTFSVKSILDNCILLITVSSNIFCLLLFLPPLSQPYLYIPADISADVHSPLFKQFRGTYWMHYLCYIPKSFCYTWGRSKTLNEKGKRNGCGKEAAPDRLSGFVLHRVFCFLV